jgi:hypothetical protein
MQLLLLSIITFKQADKKACNPYTQSFVNMITLHEPLFCEKKEVKSKQRGEKVKKM